MKKLVVLMAVLVMLAPAAVSAQRAEEPHPLYKKDMKLIPKDVIIHQLKPQQEAPPAQQQTPAPAEPEALPSAREAQPQTMAPAQPPRLTAPATPAAPSGGAVVFSSDAILFEFGSAKLRQASIPQLREIAGALNDPQLAALPFFYVDGHTCDIGTDANNCRLAYNRAQSVIDYLIKEGGVSPAKLKARGFGPNDPMVANSSEDNRRQNRRVVLKSGSVTLARDRQLICRESDWGGRAAGAPRSESRSDPDMEMEPHEPVFGGLGPIKDEYTFFEDATSMRRKGMDDKKEMKPGQVPAKPAKPEAPRGFKKMEVQKDQIEPAKEAPKAGPAVK